MKQGDSPPTEYMRPSRAIHESFDVWLCSCVLAKIPFWLHNQFRQRRFIPALFLSLSSISSRTAWVFNGQFHVYTFVAFYYAFIPQGRPPSCGLTKGLLLQTVPGTYGRAPVFLSRQIGSTAIHLFMQSISSFAPECF